MALLKNIRFARFTLFIIALQVLNMSIDVPAVQMNNGGRAGDFNYVDTYVEFIAEVLMRIENAIPEQRHRQHRELQMHKQVQVICQQIEIVLQSRLHALMGMKNYPTYTNNYRYQLTREINHPPSFVG
ncbi:MAG: hypothetical protein M3015_13370 [Bacteroidota bacterium]|nr:hypothetical protein [Bacteroidota bacterium]